MKPEAGDLKEKSRRRRTTTSTPLTSYSLWRRFLGVPEAERPSLGDYVAVPGPTADVRYGART